MSVLVEPALGQETPTRGFEIEKHLRQIPGGWTFRRAKYHFREIDFRSQSGQEELLSVSHTTGVTPRSEKNVTMFEAESYEGSKLCWENDLVINTLWAWMGALGVSSQHGIVSPAYGVYRFRNRSEFNARYVDHLLRTPIYKAEYFCRSTGIRASRLRLYPEDFLRIPLLCPPREEQDAIVAFLDRKLEEIDRFIANKRRLIELLEAERKSIRQRAVTRGLDANRPLEQSGIFWLPEIPVGWTAGRIKSEFENLNTRRIPLNTVERGEMKSRKYDYYGASGVIDKVDEYLFDEDLILIAEDGANLVLRNLRLSIVARGRYWVNNHAHILRPRRGDLFFLAELLEAVDYNPWISGAAQPKLTKDRLMAVEIPVPPPEEQEEIGQHLQREFARIDRAAALIEEEVNLMNEFRQSLVAEAVTGKLALHKTIK